MMTPAFGEWQPIETAPKDGSEFQAWTKYGAWKPLVSWRDGAWCECEGNDFWRWSRLFTPLYHWMPLPHPPQETEQNGD